MRIIVGFSKPKKQNVISWLIMKICKTEYSHTYFQYKEKITGDEMIIEASHGEVHEQLLDSWLEHNVIVKEYASLLSIEKYIKFQHFINRALNMPYNKSLLIGILIEKIFRIKNNIGMSGTKFICSKLVADGLNIPYDKWIEPKQVDEYLKGK